MAKKATYKSCRFGTLINVLRDVFRRARKKLTFREVCQRVVGRNCRVYEWAIARTIAELHRRGEIRRTAFL